MFDKSEILLHLYSETLTRQFRSKKPDFQVIYGALQGLASLLVHFSGDFLSGMCVFIVLFLVVCYVCRLVVMRYCSEILVWCSVNGSELFWWFA